MLEQVMPNLICQHLILARYDVIKDKLFQTFKRHFSSFFKLLLMRKYQKFV